MTHPQSSLEIPVTYRQTWDDGLGARGWKLDISIGDPAVIASTAYSGEKLPTSVLVHDMLDHYLCGFGLSGHRNEAMALCQLASRTGSDIRPDYQQMVDEDILIGHVNGEPLVSFLPDALAQWLTAHNASGAESMQALIARLGRAAVRQVLVERFFELGREGIPQARRQWLAQGLDYGRRSAISLALQRLLVQADAWAVAQDIDLAQGCFLIGNDQCEVRLHPPAGEPFTLREPVTAM